MSEKRNFTTVVADKIKEYFASRDVGFWIFIGAAVFALACDIIYVVFYKSVSMRRYYSKGAFALPFVGIAASLVLVCLRPTEKWAPFVLFGFELISFCLFINATYMHLTVLAYATSAGEGLASLNIGFILTAVFLFVTMAACIVALFFRMRKADKIDGLSESADMSAATAEQI